MTQQLLTLGEFCTDLPEWYEVSRSTVFLDT